MTQGSGPVLRLDGVTKRFDQVTAVDAVDLEIREGEFITLLGPSGSGKSTILKLIAGFDTPSAGEIYLYGEPLSGVPPHRRQVGMVFQNYALFPHLSIFENIAFALRNLRWPRHEIDQRVAELLQMVRLQGLEDRLPGEVSGGQQQRAALARALSFRPPVLLLDEPLGALDKNLRAEMLVEFRRLHRNLRTTMVFVTHDQEEALAMSDRVAVIDGGRIKRLGTPRELYEDPRHLFVADFLGDANIWPGTARGPGTISIRDAEWEVRIDHDLPVGTSVTAAVRPEKIWIGPPRDDSNVLQGRVEEILYVGPMTKYTIRVGADHVVVVKQLNRYHSPELQIGADVTLCWHKQDGMVIVHDQV